jgi:hypothetical protein
LSIEGRCAGDGRSRRFFLTGRRSEIFAVKPDIQLKLDMFFNTIERADNIEDV